MPAFHRLALLATLVAVPVGAQSGLLAGVGVARYDQADALASAAPYGGTGPWVGLEWRHDGVRTLRGLQLTFATARLTPTAAGTWTASARAFNGAIAFHWLRGLETAGRSRFYAGGRLRAIASVRSHYFATGAREIYGDLIVAPELAGAWVRRLGPAGRLRVELDVPVASVAWRTPYYGAKTVPSTRLGGPGRLRGATLETEYARMLSPGLGAVVRLGVQAWRYPEPRPMTAVTQWFEVRMRLGGAIP